MSSRGDHHRIVARSLLRGVVAAGVAFSQPCAAQQQDTPQSAAVEAAAPDILPTPGAGPAPVSPSPFPQGTAAEPFGPVGAAGIPVGQGGSGIRLGPGTLYSAIGLVLKHDDNLFLSNTNRKSSTLAVVTPVVRFEVKNRGNVYDLAYRADHANYWDSSADNFNDQQLLANANFTFTTRARLKLRAEYLYSHDPRGSTDRANSAEPDRWRAPGVSAVFTYGSIGAIGRIEVETGYQHKRYINNPATTAASDHDTAFVGGTFYYRWKPKTTLLFQVRQTHFDYTQDTALLSSMERRYLAGVKWEATDKTTALFKIGQVKKNFDAGSQPGFTGLSWEGELIWSPRTYSVFRVITAQQTAEATGIGNVILGRSILGLWTHGWNSQTTSNVSLGFRNDNFEGSSPARVDNTRTAGLQLTYQMSRRLNAGAGYTYNDRASTIPGAVYNRNLFMLTLGAAL